MFISFYSALQGPSQGAMATPLSLQSLQPVRRRQVLVPDSAGVLWHRNVHEDTLQHINALISSDEMMDATSNVAAFGPIQSSLMPFNPMQPANIPANVPTTPAIQQMGSLMGSQQSQASALGQG